MWKVTFATVASATKCGFLGQMDYSKEIFGHIIGMATKALRRKVNSYLNDENSGLNVEQAIVMIHLLNREGLNQGQIADLIDRDKTSATRIIDVLESLKLVSRFHDINDRRKNMIKLTKRGKEKTDDLLSLMKRAQSEALKNIEPEHLEICRNVLKKVVLNLSDNH